LRIFVSAKALARCGFANFASPGIMIACLSVIAAERRADILSPDVKAIVSGTLTTCLMSAAVVALNSPIEFSPMVPKRCLRCAIVPAQTGTHKNKQHSNYCMPAFAGYDTKGANTLPNAVETRR
jgi:hypothetical protein